MSGKRKIMCYDESRLKNALEAIRNGTQSIRSASKVFQVPRSTLQSKLSGKSPEERWVGGKTSFTKEEEEDIVKWILDCADAGQPVTKDQLLETAEILCNATKKDTRFKNNRPGKKWYKSFMRRHPVLSERISQNLSTARAEVTKEDISQWFSKVEEYLNRKGLMNIDPSRIFNCDETAISLCPKGGKVLAAKGRKAVHSVVNAGEKENMTFLYMASADGELYPPLIVHKYVRVPAIVRNTTPHEWGIGLSQSGWMTAQVFFDYFKNIFYPEVLRRQIQFPVVVFLDGHRSHMSMALAEFCQQVQIEIVFLFPNSTHLLQPLDLAFFKPLKDSHKKAVLEWRRKNPDQRLRKDNIAPVVKSSLDAMHNIKDIIQSGFKESGIYPWDSNAINTCKIFAEASSDDNMTKENAQEVITSDIENNILQKESIEAATSTTASGVFSVCSIEEDLPLNILEQFLADENDGVFRGPIQYQELFYLWKKIKTPKESQDPVFLPSSTLVNSSDLGVHEQSQCSQVFTTSPTPLNSSNLGDHDQPQYIQVFTPSQTLVNSMDLEVRERPHNDPIFPNLAASSTPLAELLEFPKRKIVQRKNYKKRAEGPLSLTNRDWIENEKKKIKERDEKEREKEAKRMERLRKRAIKEEEKQKGPKRLKII